jgi:hypothetical protein
MDLLKLCTFFILLVFSHIWLNLPIGGRHICCSACFNVILATLASSQNATFAAAACFNVIMPHLLLLLHVLMDKYHF